MAKVDPAQLSPDQLAKLLSSAGGEKISADQVHESVKAGAPTNRDGTLHVMHYTAWLVQQEP